MGIFSKVAFACALAASVVTAQDPAQGWLAYATAKCPAGKRLTSLDMKWKVLDNAPVSQSFYSPWFGSDTSDNLNLIQPVNPWMGSSWELYTEYFQWSPEYNSNSPAKPTAAGHVLHGSLTFLGDAQQAYRLIQTDMNTGASSTQVVKVQKDTWGQAYKNYTIMYIVFEKVAYSCSDYPPNEMVRFYDINAYCDGEKVSPQWTTSYVEDVCDFRAHAVRPDLVEITWNTASSKAPTKEQAMRSQTGPKAIKPSLMSPRRGN